MVLLLGAIENSLSLSSLLNNAVFRNTVFKDYSDVKLIASILPKFVEINQQFIMKQLSDKSVTLLFEDYLTHHSISYRICLADSEGTYFWKWICNDIQHNDASAIASIIQNEISLLSEMGITITGFASSHSEVMQDVIRNELLKKQILLQPVPYVSFMIEDIFREFFCLPKIQTVWNYVMFETRSHVGQTY